MQKWLESLALCVVVTFIGACAHHRDVRPGPGGVNRVEVSAESRSDGYEDAFGQAEHYCEQTNKRPIVLSEADKYVGDMDESTYKKTKTISKVAKAGGGAAWVFGDRDVSRVGGAAVIGGTIADAYAGDGYRFSMKFKCKR